MYQIIQLLNENHKCEKTNSFLKLSKTTVQNKMKKKTPTTLPSEQFQNPIEKFKKETKSISQTHMAWYRHFNKKWQD
jgi:hypothetical protein